MTDETNRLEASASSPWRGAVPRVPAHGDSPGRLVATIGAFDGVHLGHQELLAQVVARAVTLGCESLAVTFDPHPDVVLYPDRHLTELSDREQKEQLMRGLGIDHVIVFDFTRELSMLRPEEFISQIQTQHPLKELWVGSDFALGRGRSGTISALVEIGSASDFALHVVPPVKITREKISSTFIRTLLTQGDVERAAGLLGRRYALSGTVLRGAERGRTLNFPTANLKPRQNATLPADGVYAALVAWNGKLHPAVVNVGARPTFDDSERLLEAHLLDFSQDLYGKHLSIEFVKRLRETRRFNDADELRTQIARDVQAARALPELKAAAPSEESPMAEPS